MECVVNVSEGRDPAVVAAIAAAGGPCLLDVHSDADHHRSVLTLAGPRAAVEEAARAVAGEAVDRLDIGGHRGVHPRIGAVDVVPFVALDRVAGGVLADGPLDEALAARDAFAGWAGAQLQLPCFLYGPDRSLPQVRRGAWSAFPPDTGPATPHPTAGSCAVGARPVLVAYNLWLGPGATLAGARRTAAAVRGPGLRSLGLAVGDDVQVSCNLIDPWRVGPGAAYDLVAEAVGRSGGPAGRRRATSEAGVVRAELIGLLPRAVLDAEPPGRWAELGLDPSATIEARLERAGLDGGSF